MMKQITRTVLITCLLPCTFIIASPKSKLTKVNADIKATQLAISTAKTQKITLEASLQKTALAEKAIRRNLNKTHTHLSSKHVLLTQTALKEATLTTDLLRNKQKLTQQIKSIYTLSNQPQLKLFFDTNNFEASQRMLTYARYITTAQKKSIGTLTKKITYFQQKRHLLKKQYAQLLSLQHSQRETRRTLKAQHHKGQYTLQQITQNIHKRQAKLHQLIHDKQALEKTLAALRLAATKTTISKYGLSFLKGKLPWPVKGLVHHYFGTQIAQSELRWNGTVIDAPINTPIHAIAPGQVIFAKWLAGYGRLVIINHGKGYLSLYGRNQTITTKVGDWVKANDVIATVGKTGGFKKPGLYFSIRHQKTPLNPIKWCH